MNVRRYVVLIFVGCVSTAFAGVSHSALDLSSLSITMATPPAPVLTGTTPAPPSANASPVVHGTSDPGVTIKIYKSAACSGPVAATTTADGLGNFSTSVTVNSNTATSLSATAQDMSGTSPCSNALSYQHDNLAPASPTLTGTTPASPSNNSNPVVNGVSEPNALINVYLNGTCSGPPAASAVTGSGTFNIAINVPLNATTTITVTATDQAGNTSLCSSAISYTHDDSPPGPPSFTGTSPASPANNNHPHILGTTEPGAAVSLYTNVSCSGQPVATGTADGLGAFDLKVDVANNSSTTFYAHVNDGAGNGSTCTASGITYVEDSNLPTGSICGFKFLDTNGNGIYEPGLGESPVQGWTVYAVSSSSDTLTVTTDVNGSYCFNNVTDTFYTVFESPRDGYIQTGGEPYYLLTMGGVTIDSVDFGNFKTGQIYGTKFNDLNGDSLNNNEPGLPDWGVCLVRKDAVNASIDYLNASGSFTVQLDAAPGSPVSGALAGTFSDHRGTYSPESNVIPIELTTLDLRSSAPVNIDGNQGSVGMKLWHGRQAGGIQGDGNDPADSFFDLFLEIDITSVGPGGGCYVSHSPLRIGGISNSVPFPQGTVLEGTNLQLFDKATDQPAGTLDSLRFVVGAQVSLSTPMCTLTDSLGKFSFVPLLPGTYNLHEVQQSCWEQTTSDPAPITIQSGDSLTAIDFGNHQRETRICVLKYFDENHNQVLDPGEGPMEGIEFILTGSAPANVFSGFTDVNGSVCFSNIPPDAYVLTENIPGGYAVGVPKSGSMSFNITACHDTTVTWMNTAAFTDSLFRTATVEQWALSPDLKGKRKPIKCKPDKVDFKFNLRWKLDHLTLKFPMYTRGEVRIGKDKQQSPIASWDSTKTAEIVLPGIDTSQVLQIDGRGFKGKQISVIYQWSTAGIVVAKGKLPGGKTVDPLDSLKLNVLRLPMPNLHNIGQDLQQQGVFPILVGSLSGPNSVVHFKYTDVQKSLVKDDHGIPTFHRDSTRCLDSVKNKPVVKQLKTFPPNVFGGNRLFAEVLALKLNIFASQKGKFPPGLDTLIYDYSAQEPGHPLNGHSIAEICRQADSILMCNTNPKGFGLSPLDYYVVVHRINSAFNSPSVDTISWSCSKLRLKGVKSLKSVPWLFAHPGSIQTVAVPDIPPAPEPSSFVLGQNYPNPFNPVTTIQFELLEPAIVTLKVYNTLGQEVASLLENQLMEDGTEEVEFDATNLSSGVYFYRIIVQGLGDEEEGIPGQYVVSTKKMLLMK